MLYLMKARTKFNKELDESFEIFILDEKNEIVSAESMGYVIESAYSLQELVKNYTLWSFQNSHINPRQEKIVLTQKRLQEVDDINDTDDNDTTP